MPQAASLFSLLLPLVGCAFAGLNIWPSLHVALSNASVFVDFSIKSNNSTIRSRSLSLVNIETNTTLLTRTLPSNQSAGSVEFNCSCFLYAGTFRFLLRQTSISAVSRANGTDECSTESTVWWWSSELQVQWPTFHIAVERAGNHSGSFQIRISTNEHFQACSRDINSALFIEVSSMEHNQIGRNSIDKIRARTRQPIKPLRSQSIELSCAFPFTEKDFIRVALRSPHAAQDVKSSGPLYLSRIFSYKLLVENGYAYRSGCEGTMAVKLITPPCAHINGKVLLYKDAGVGTGVSSEMGAGGTAVMGFGPEEPSSPPLAFNWLTQGENETEFNCSVFDPGRNKYCFRFVFNFSRSPSPAQTCLVVHRSAESWGPWQQWSVCSVSCGEGVRERVRECLLPSGVGGMQCTGMVKEQSLCSLEDCVALPAPSPSLPPVPAGVAPLGGNMVVVAGISLCLAVILATVVVTVWRKLCQTPQCSSVRRASMHSPGGRKLSDEASICGHSLQRPSLSDGQGVGVGVAQKNTPVLGSQPLSQTLVIPVSQDPERLSPTGQKMLPTIFGYRLAQQQLKEMKKKGLKEATQLYHVSSSPVHDTLVETSASPTISPIPTPTGFAHPALPLGLQDDTNHNSFRDVTSFSEPPGQTSRFMPDRQSPRVDFVLGPLGSGGSSKWRDRTADWVEMVERSGLVGPRSDAGNSSHKNPNFRRTSSFNDCKPQPPPSARSRQFRERSMTQASTDQPDPPTQPGLLPGDDAAAPPREALITTAVKFLQNPKVRQSPLATRKAFLKKKGLTDVEVELAIQRSGSTEEILPLSPVGPPHPLHATHLVPAPHSPTGYRWRDYGAFTIIMVGIAFGFHHLYKKYILPLIMGSREDKKHLQRMESNIAAMSGTLTQTVSQLQQTLVSIQELLVQQQQRIQELSQELATAEASSSTSRVLDNQTVGELKAEIISLKGLLLSRKQFPSTPTIPKIPAWQIPLKPPSAPGSPSINNSSSDISPVSNESANSSPVKDGHHSPQDALGGPDGAHGINGDVGTTLPLDLKDQVRMEVQGEEEKKEEEDDVSHVEEEEEEEGLSMQTEDRRGGDGQINEQVDKLRRPEGASNESEVD